MEPVEQSDKYLVEPFSQGSLLKNLVATEGERIGEELGRAQPTAGGRAARRGGMMIEKADPRLEQLQNAQAQYQRVASSQEGVCAALSHKWIKTKLKEQNRLGAHGVKIKKNDFVKSSPADRMHALSRTPTLKRAVERQLEYADDPNPFLGYDKLASRYKLQDKHGLTGYIHGKTQMVVPDSVSAAASRIIGCTHCCFLIAISCPKLQARDAKAPPGHAMACYVSSGDKLLNALTSAEKKGHVYFFDPNYGEYCVPKLEFSSFLREFLYSRYGVEDKNLRSMDQWSV